MAIATTEEPEISPESEVAEQMIFAWWNTSLSPTGKKRADKNHKQIAKKIVKSLVDDLKIDCLALGEITNADLSSMRDDCESKTLSIYEGTLKKGRLQFDTGLIYNNSRLTIADSLATTSAHGKRNYKISNRIDFVFLSDGVPVHVFVSHWPSRATNEENILSRDTIAVRLKDQLNTLDKTLPGAAIIVMGDFNDEPFDKSLSWHLLATRDRQLAQTKEGYLYNPFWRQLGESEPHVRSPLEAGTAGSCFYKGSTETRWRTFDQILFSPAFLGKSAWHLNEKKTTILRTKYLIELVQSEKVHFDHLPVLSVIEKFKSE